MKNFVFTVLFCFASVSTTFAQADKSDPKTIHVYVALCDNKHQGIVPVPAAIGDGQKPDSNLYWGCSEGVRSYFKKSKDWKLLDTKEKDGIVLERLVFKHASKNYYLVADGYDGQFIKECIKDFLASSCGDRKGTIEVDGKTLGIGGNSSLVAYVGHNGLMDWRDVLPLPETFKNTDGQKRDVIILACASKRYFAPLLENAHVNPLVWTTDLMYPGAFILHDALAGYINGETNEAIRERAAAAYARNQRCGLKGARGLLVTGW